MKNFVKTTYLHEIDKNFCVHTNNLLRSVIFLQSPLTLKSQNVKMQPDKWK
jgi:hypothetical protein